MSVDGHGQEWSELEARRRRRCARRWSCFGRGPGRPVRERGLGDRLRQHPSCSRARRGPDSARRASAPDPGNARAGGRRTRPSGPPASRRPRGSRRSPRCCTSSHSPTPPACGQTGTPYFAASSSSASTSLTPPTRQASIWQMPIASAWRSCLNMTRLWACSPVATRIGATACSMRGVPEDVVRAGGFLDPPRVELRQPPHPARSPRRRPSTWLASIISSAPGRARRGSMRRGDVVVSRSPPTFIFTCVTRRRRASRLSAATLSSGYPSQPAEWCTPGSRPRRARASRSACAARARRAGARAPPRG